jgi:hypothetical protein
VAITKQVAAWLGRQRVELLEQLSFKELGVVLGVLRGCAHVFGHRLRELHLTEVVQVFKMPIAGAGR